MTLDIRNTDDHLEYIFAADKAYKRLRLLVVLSPIFIASFDNGSYELEYLKKSIEISKYPYGLYPKFFDGFDINSYYKDYENKEVNEDIYIIDKDNLVHFRINKLDPKYEKALASLIEGLILDDSSLAYYLDYFANIRDEIVINGRRSILANGIQAFYLSKYVVVWMIDLCEYLYEKSPHLRPDIKPIYDLANNLKTPAMIGGNNEHIS